jgi:hypothetical protein
MRTGTQQLGFKQVGLAVALACLLPAQQLQAQPSGSSAPKPERVVTSTDWVKGSTVLKQDANPRFFPVEVGPGTIEVEIDDVTKITDDLRFEVKFSGYKKNSVKCGAGMNLPDHALKIAARSSTCVVTQKMLGLIMVHLDYSNPKARNAWIQKYGGIEAANEALNQYKDEVMGKLTITGGYRPLNEAEVQRYYAWLLPKQYVESVTCGLMSCSVTQTEVLR